VHPSKPPLAVTAGSLAFGALAVYFLVTTLDGASGLLEVFLSLVGTAFLAAVSRGLARLRAWAWFAATLGMLLAAAVVFVRIVLAVDAASRGKMEGAEALERTALFVVLVVALRALAREKIERLYRPGHFAN
jgi:hypothetical protein